ncbi:MAG: serine/threonine protein kinase [Cyanobacteria bacterium]|nr:serine/threonine protein kinase [Cyanobacteriota bacterium]
MLSPGARIDDRYEIISALGAGGMGAVYRARRLHLGDEVAIKVMQATPDAAPESRDRFLRESRACAQLRHPNIVGLLDFGFDTSNQPYMVMELLSGPSLLEEIKLEAPMAPARVIGILESVASAVQLAHDRGITHRDLKPANIVAHKYDSGDRVYKVIDFGLAAMKAGQDETRLTDPAFFLGTLAYAAPEQLRGEEVTASADVYAIGVIAHEMLTGGRPFDSSNKATLITKILTIDPSRETTRRSNLPQAVEDAVMKALSKETADRWPSVSAFIDALKAAIGQTPAPATSGAVESGLLSRYELGPLLGRGRLGSFVYQGTHRALGTSVAIRVLRRDETPHWDAVRARFLLEARTLQTSHPSLLQIRDFGEDDRGVYVVSDLIDGPSLRQAMTESGPFPWARAKHLLTQALEAASALHARGGFICGVNPDMIRIQSSAPERIVMSSAGIKSVQDVLATMREQELRGQEASANELPYVAPEVLMGFAPNARADVFTIGVLAYQMVTASLPFKAASLPELIGQALQTKPSPPQGDLPDAARDAIMKAIDSVPANRFESADAFARAIA